MTIDNNLTGPMRGPLRKRESSLWHRHPDDWYAEPVWCSARLFEVGQFFGAIHDPACGFGRIVESARAAGYEAFGTDKCARPGNWPIRDFLEAGEVLAPNIVSNPPFGIAERFVSRAIDLSARKTAMLLPANWVQGDTRSRWLETTPLLKVLFITPRPSMPPGPVIEAGVAPGNGTTDYAWFIWQRDYDGKPEIGWLRRDKP